MPTGEEGVDVDGGRSLSDAERRALNDRSKSGVAAGRALFDAGNPRAAARRERAALVQDLARELRGLR